MLSNPMISGLNHVEGKFRKPEISEGNFDSVRDSRELAALAEAGWPLE